MLIQKPEVSIVADSISAGNKRITTFKLRYWRPIHSELMTHRDFSRNAGSSRARPVKAVAQGIIDNPWGPREFGANQAGMQSAGEHTAMVDLPKHHWYAYIAFLNERGALSACEANDNYESIVNGYTTSMQADPKDYWEFLAWFNGTAALAYAEAGFHKQVANRITEPFGYIDVLVTATKYRNFFTLRVHPDAQPEIQDLATLMQEAMSTSVPNILRHGEWHLPFIDTETSEQVTDYIENGLHRSHAFLAGVPDQDIQTQIEICVSCARCARVSYKMYDGSKCIIEADLELYSHLLVSRPLHASPAEHQATPDKFVGGSGEIYANPEKSGNLGAGWIQYRKLLPNEYVG